MITFDETAFRNRLISEGYSSARVDEMVKNIVVIDERLNDALNAWIADGTIMNFAIEGVTLADIMEKTKANFYYALLTMTVFIENPEMAKTFLETPLFIR